MRRFFSYGPVDCKEHFCVPRLDLVEKCYRQLVAKSEKGGHFFTIWSPRQCGKTWLVEQVRKRIEERHSDAFSTGIISMQGVILRDDSSDEELLSWFPSLINDAFGTDIQEVKDWRQWSRLFHRTDGVFNKPVILFIDEFDVLPPKLIDRLLTLFRSMYLKRENYVLHGLALIGVRAVLGVDSERGSPFNIQRSLHVPNFTREEVEDLFDQYRSESGQAVESETVRKVFESTRGQPGLVCWFGELLTEKYNPGPEKPVDLSVWKTVYGAALHKEWNNTVLNLIKKAMGPYAEQVVALFGRSDMPFSIRAQWCSYLYLNGIVEGIERTDASGNKSYACRFSSPFVQACLYEAFAMDFAGDSPAPAALEPLDTLSDVFEKDELDVAALLLRYKGYLKRLKAREIDVWKGQPRRADLCRTEYVGHFHLYSWLKQAIEDRCVVSPEFPTGNGRVDLHLQCGAKSGIIEVKSFESQSKLDKARQQAARYAKKLRLPSIAIALFLSMDDDEILKSLSGEQVVDGIRVNVVAIGW